MVITPAARKGSGELTYTRAGSHGRSGTSVRPIENTRAAVSANASAIGSRSAHSLRPKAFTLAAIAQ